MICSTTYIENNYGYEKPIDWGCGGCDTNMLSKTFNRLKQWNVNIYFSDNWKSYVEVILKDYLLQTNKESHRLERNNTTQKDINLLVLEEKQL